MPGEETRLRDEEVVSQSEYQMMLNGGQTATPRIDQDSGNFDFENSRGINASLNSTQEGNLKELAKNMTDEDQFENQMEMSSGIMNDIRNSVLVTAVN